MILFHRNRARRTTFGTEAALDTAGFVFEDHGRIVALLCFIERYAAVRLNQGGQFFVPLDLIKPCHAEAVFWTDIDTSAAEDAFGAIKNREDVALEAPDGLLTGRPFENPSATSS